MKTYTATQNKKIMALEPDIIERIHKDFIQGSADRAIELLTDSGYTGRIARCLVVVSRGSIDTLQSQIELANLDTRDVIMAGEYEGIKRVRDLKATFLIEKSEDWWIGNVAASLKDCRLVSFQTRRATVGPFTYPTDEYEGTAIFESRIGVIKVEKHDRQWTLLGGSNELDLFGLGAPIIDEHVFIDEVNCYLLAKKLGFEEDTARSGSVNPTVPEIKGEFTNRRIRSMMESFAVWLLSMLERSHK